MKFELMINWFTEVHALLFKCNALLVRMLPDLPTHVDINAGFIASLSGLFTPHEHGFEDFVVAKLPTGSRELLMCFLNKRYSMVSKVS